MTYDNVFVKLTNQSIDDVRQKDQMQVDSDDDSIDVPDII